MSSQEQSKKSQKKKKVQDNVEAAEAPVELKVKKSKKIVEEPVVKVEEPVVEAAEAPVEEAPTDSLTFDEEYAKVIAFQNRIKEMIKEMNISIKNFRTLNKRKTLEEGKRNKKNKKRERTNSTPHGFAKETYLSQDLLEFLGLPEGTMMPSPQVTRQIAKYVRDNELYIEGINNKSIFRCDDKLFKLLGEPNFDVSTKKDGVIGKHHSYFNLQKTMKERGHYIKAEA